MMKRISSLLIYLLLSVCAFAENHATTVRFDDIEAREPMYTAETIDDAFVWKEQDSDGSNTAMTIGERGEGSIGPNSVTMGNNNVASGNNSIAAGQNAVASNDTSFVWSGASGTNTFGSNGTGTFNVNPVGGLTGFYVGGTSLYDQISEMVQPSTAEEDFIMYYNTSFDEWPHVLNIVSNKNQFYELKEDSVYPAEPLVLSIPKTTPLKYVRLCIYIHQSPTKNFHYDIASDNIDSESYPTIKWWLADETQNDEIWKFEFDSFPGFEDWVLVRYTKREMPPPPPPPETTLYYSNGDIVKTNIIGLISRSNIQNRENLTKVTLGTNVTGIEEELFFGCANLTNVNILGNIPSIDRSTFDGCSSLVDIIIPNSVTIIGQYAFVGCSSLSNIVIPDSVSLMGSSVFYNCSNLANVNIGSGINDIGIYTFTGCINLTNITMSGKTVLDVKNMNYESWGLPAKCEIHCVDGNLPEAEQSTFYFNDGTSTITNLVGEVPQTYRSNANLTEAHLGINVTGIGPNAFSECSKLNTVSIPESVTTIKNYAFSQCQGLPSIDIPASVTNIGYRTFSTCRGLETISIGGETISIGNQAFLNCTNVVLMEFKAKSTNDIPSMTNYSTWGLSGNCLIQCTDGEFYYP